LLDALRVHKQSLQGMKTCPPYAHRLKRLGLEKKPPVDLFQEFPQLRKFGDFIIGG
jgi:hypothetical protein